MSAGQLTGMPIGRPVTFDDPVKFSEMVSDYFDRVAMLREVPTITGLAVYLDTDRKTLYNYRSKDDFFPTIKRALAKCEAAIEQRAMLGGINATMAIFSLKNNYGWVDQTQVDNKIQVVQPILELPNQTKKTDVIDNESDDLSD